jgi:hypothetical protein
MGTLNPGVTYVYEKADGITYARESGSPISSRVEIGRDYDVTLREEKILWGSIIEASRNDAVLHEAMERVKVLYYLSKNNDSKT